MSEQLSFLSDPDENRPGFFSASRRPTQVDAAYAVYPRTGTQRRKVLNLIARAGERGLTDEEMQRSLRLPGNSERPRRLELEEGGWIVDSGRVRGTSASGNPAIVWVLSAEAARVWVP